MLIFVVVTRRSRPARFDLGPWGVCRETAYASASCGCPHCDDRSCRLGGASATRPRTSASWIMQITAAVMREKSSPFVIETLELTDPRPDELLVQVVASGMCQTDLHARDGYYS